MTEYYGHRQSKDTDHIYNGKEIALKPAMEWMRKNSRGYLSKGQPIYRGMETNHPVGFVDTLQDNFNRMSANTRNYYTVWMDNDKSWKGYPKRSKSLICSTAYSKANSFGEAHIIIPADKNLIGVCTEADLWESFPQLVTMGAGTDIVSDFIENLHAIVTKAAPDLLIGDPEINYSDLVKTLKGITPEKIAEASAKMQMPPHKSFTGASRAFSNKFDWIERILSSKYASDGSMLNYFREALDPVKNKFELKTGASFHNVPKNHEIWVQGPCIVLRCDRLNDWASMSPEYLRKKRSQDSESPSMPEDLEEFISFIQTETGISKFL